MADPNIPPHLIITITCPLPTKHVATIGLTIGVHPETHAIEDLNYKIIANTDFNVADMLDNLGDAFTRMGIVERAHMHTQPLSKNN